MRPRHPLLLFAADYMPMFKGLIDRLKSAQGEDKNVWIGWANSIQEDAKKEIQWAKEVLQKNDRIVWYLRWIRLRFIHRLEVQGVLSEGTTQKELSALSAKAGKSLAAGDILQDLPRFKRDLQHYLSLDDQAIQSKVFAYETPMELMEDFASLEADYKQRHEEDQRLLEPHPGDKEFLKFGNGWAWWALDRGYCPEEAKAMGHCGNQGMVTGDQIISLREPRKKGGKQYWEPHLTFIFDKETGMLGEMKGRGNEKPAARYHPYIVSLLKDRRIKGIRGGGYMPSHNFSMNDLPEKERADLEKAKPALMTLKRQLQKMGVVGASGTVETRKNKRTGKWEIAFPSKAVEKQIVNKVSGMLGLKNDDFNLKFGGWIVADWSSVQEFIREKGDRDAEWLLDADEGDINQWEFGSSDHDTTMELLDDVKPQTLLNIGLALEYEYPDELRDFVEEQGGSEEFTWEPDQAGDVKDFLSYLINDQGIEPDVWGEMETAIRYGYEAGSSNEVAKAIKDAVEEATDDSETIEIKWDGDNIWGGRIYAVVSVKDTIEAALACEANEEGCDTDHYENSFVEGLLDSLQVKGSAEHRDFTEYDEKAAIEHLDDTYSKPPKRVKKPVEGQEEMFPDALQESK